MATTSKENPDELEPPTLASDSKTLADAKTAPTHAAARPPVHDAPQIPDHELITRIGRGSYGEVWLAKNVMGFYRAVKLVYRATFEHARPFDREFNGIKKFEPISRSHDGLVDVLQVGRTGDYFYYVMEIADDVATGQEIDPAHYRPKTLHSEVKERGRLPFERCLEVALTLTQGLGHMHTHGLIHRDIKPSNIIFVHGQAKLADIGLVAEQSEAKSFVGTEGFIPPEGPGAPQADIYSLGKVLYEIATGKDRHEFPTLPTLLGEAGSDTHLLELNSVFLKACQNDLKQRYHTCEQMRDDLLLLQGGKSVKRSQVVERRLRKLTQASVVGVTVTLMAIAALSYAKTQERKAQLHAKREAGLRQRAEQSEFEAQRNLYSADMLAAQQAFESSNLGRAMELLEMHRPRQGAPDLRGWEWRYLWGRCQGEELLTLAGHPSGVLSVAFSPDGNRLASGDHDGNVKVWDLASRKDVITLKLDTRSDSLVFTPDGRLLVTSDRDGNIRFWDARTFVESTPPLKQKLRDNRMLAISPDGTMLATLGMEAVNIWNIQTRGLVTNFPLQHPELRGFRGGVAFSPDGKTLAYCDSGGILRLRDWTVGTLIGSWTNQTQNILSLAFSPDGNLLATAGDDAAMRAVSVMDINTGALVARLVTDKSGVTSIAFSPDGRTLAAASYNQTVKLWDVPSGRELATLRGHRNEIWMLAFSPNGRQLATASRDFTVKLWNVSRSTSEFPIHTMPSGVVDFNMTPDRLRFWTAHGNASTLEMVKLWEPATMREQARVEFPPLTNWSCVFPFDQGVLIGFRDGTIKSWDFQTGRETHVFHGLTNRISLLWLSPQRDVVIAGSDDRALKFWDMATGMEVASFAHEGPGSWSANGSSVSLDGQQLIATSFERSVAIWDVKTRRKIVEFKAHDQQVNYTAFSHDGKLLATVGGDGLAKVWDWRAQKEIATFRGTLNALFGVAFSLDDRRLAVGSYERAEVWDLATHREVAQPRGNTNWVLVVNFLDENTLFTASWREAVIWRAPSFDEIEKTETANTQK